MTFMLLLFHHDHFVSMIKESNLQDQALCKAKWAPACLSFRQCTSGMGYRKHLNL